MSSQMAYRDLYKKILNTFNLGSVGTEILGRIMAGSEKSDDYEEILKVDRFFTTTICGFASANMKTSVVKSLGHGVVLVGQEKVRNFVLGHLINRLFNTAADSEFSSFENTGKKPRFALQAEEQSRKCQNEYTGMALASGYLFDIFAEWLAHDPKLTAFVPLLESTWGHSLRAASIAWALATHERVLISHRKIIFSAALLHEIGKLGLAVYDPEAYTRCVEKMKKERDTHADDDIYDVAIEKEEFDLSHSEVGSAILFQTRVFREAELEVDFHHDSTLLRMRNPDAFLGAAVINIADRISWMLERNTNFQVDDLREILKTHTAYFPLKPADVMELCAQLRAKGSLTVK